MTSREILVTGATGRIGGLVARELVESGVRPRALVRDLAAARKVLPPAVVPIVGDLEDPASLQPAVAGVDALFLVSPVHPQQRTLQGNLVRAAAASGRPLVIKISGLGTALDSFVDSGRWHAETEQDIRELSLPFTFLRPYYLMQNLGTQLAGARTEGVLRGGAGDPRIAMVDTLDVAAVAARLLAGEVDRVGLALDLTGPEALTTTEVALQIGEALGRDVAYEPLAPAAARSLFERIGMPDWRIDILDQFNRAFAKGWAADISNAVEQVLGRGPRKLAAYLDDALHDVGREQDG